MERTADNWIVAGVDDDHPDCLHTVEELKAYIRKVGYLPYFANEVKGFSVEERTNPRYWWSDHEERDPWVWRMVIAREHEIAYGKFFNGKAGFIMPEYLPQFIRERRQDRSFDELWLDGLVSLREKKLMDCIREYGPLFSHDLKRLAGFGKNGEKNFDGTIAALQNNLFLTISDFRQKINRSGEPYGWHIAQYAQLEDIFRV